RLHPELLHLELLHQKVSHHVVSHRLVSHRELSHLAMSHLVMSHRRALPSALEGQQLSAASHAAPSISFPMASLSGPPVPSENRATGATGAGAAPARATWRRRASAPIAGRGRRPPRRAPAPARSIPSGAPSSASCRWDS